MIKKRLHLPLVRLNFRAHLKLLKRLPLGVGWVIMTHPSSLVGSTDQVDQTPMIPLLLLAERTIVSRSVPD